ncbi:MAG: hypothetical protein KatS3mg102_2076 [Planctomycetota bacterium]|nr:MAG: hypothetical protein KatS3mg102_2076 [Planctomycetota bacterium]
MAKGGEDVALYLEKIEQAARVRRAAEERLVGDEQLTPSERMGVEATIRRENESIKLYAERVNKVLQRAARTGERLEPIKIRPSIADAQLEQFFLSVKNAIDRLNELRDQDSQWTPRAEKNLEVRLEQAERLEERAARTRAELEAKAAELQARLDRTRPLVEQREQELQEIERRLKRNREEERKLEAERKKLQDAEAAKRREQTGLERLKQNAEHMRKRAHNFEAKVQAKQQAQALQEQIDLIERFIASQIRYRLDELERIAEQLRREREQLEQARRAGSKDREQLEAEIRAVEEQLAECRKRAAEEDRRLEEIRQAKDRMQLTASQKL